MAEIKTAKELTDEEFYFEMMDEAARDYQSLIDEITANDERLLRVIAYVSGPAVVAQLREYLADEETSRTPHVPLSLVRNPRGPAYRQPEWDLLQEYHVDQWQNGGLEGDSFAGDLYLVIRPDLFLKVPYAC